MFWMRLGKMWNLSQPSTITSLLVRGGDSAVRILCKVDMNAVGPVCDVHKPCELVSFPNTDLVGPHASEVKWVMTHPTSVPLFNSMLLAYVGFSAEGYDAGCSCGQL